MKLTSIYKNVLKENVEMLDEDYPESFNLEYFKKLPSFNARIKYCQQELKRISSGTSRIAYQIDDDKVLKLAKNPKGLSQNEVEIEFGNNGYVCTATVFDSDDDGYWLEMELALPVSNADFKPLLGLSLPEMQIYLSHYENQYHYSRHYSKSNEFNQEVYDWMWEDEFFRSMFEMMGDYDLPAGDFYKKSSYGKVLRDGSPAIVLIDFGLTRGGYATHYQK